MIDWFTLAVLILAARRAAGMIVSDDFGPLQDLRQTVLARWPGPDTRFLESEVEDVFGDWQLHDGRPVMLDPDGDGTRVWYVLFPHPVGSLLSCVRCLSVWTGAVGLLLLATLPAAVWWAGALVLAVSEGVILLERQA